MRSEMLSSCSVHGSEGLSVSALLIAPIWAKLLHCAMVRKLQSVSISFGLVTIPVDLYSAVSDQDVHFHQVHAKCGTRIKQQLFCPSCERVVERSELVKGYQISKGDLVTFTQEELDKLEATESTSLEIVQFVPLASVDPIYFEDTYFLGPTKGGEKAYHLFGGSDGADATCGSGEIRVARKRESLSREALTGGSDVTSHVLCR